MEIQGVPKIGISSVVHSKHIDPDCIDVVDNDIALFYTESVVSLYSGPSKLEVVTVGLCLGGGSKFNISLREYEIVPGRMVIVLPNQIIELGGLVLISRLFSLRYQRICWKHCLKWGMYFLCSFI